MQSRSDDLKPLGAHEVAEYLNVPVSTVYSLFKSKAIKSSHIGKRYKTNMAEVEEYLKKLMK